MNKQKLPLPVSETETAQNSTRSNQVIGSLMRLLRAREAGIALVLVVMVVGLSLSTPYFLTIGNLAILARQISLSVIIAIG
ncbi:MAG: hypothetical protein ABFD29_01820, partial [Anaerolineaceae bacterium]